MLQLPSIWAEYALFFKCAAALDHHPEVLVRFIELFHNWRSRASSKKG